MTISQGPSTFSITVEPGLAVPASNSARLAWMAFSLSSKSPRLSLNVGTPEAALVHRLGRRPANLAARGPRHRAARHEHHFVHHQPAQIDDAPADGIGQIVGGHRAARLGDHDRAVRTGPGGCPERDDAAAADAGELGDAPLEILRVILPSVDDDQVLYPAAHEQL